MAICSPPAEVNTDMLLSYLIMFSVYPPCVFAPGGYFILQEVKMMPNAKILEEKKALVASPGRED